MGELRIEAARLPVSRLLRRAVRRTGLLQRAVQGGESAADIVKLVRMAEAYDRDGAGDIRGFLRHLELAEQHAGSEPRALVEAPQDAVRLMTVHRAKGLEFPVVFVADLGRPRRSDSVTALVEAGVDTVALAMRAPAEGPRGGAGASTPALEAMLESKRLAEADEEDRIFYVACTRAQRMLVLSGATDCSAGPKDSSTIDRARSAFGLRTLEPTSGQVDLSGARVGVVVEDADEAVASLTPTASAQRSEKTAAQDVTAPAPSAMVANDAESTAVQEREASPLEPAKHVPPARLSFSDLDAYRRCALRWHLVRDLGLPEMGTSGGAGARAFGSAVHSALEMGEGRSPERLQAIARHERLSAEDAQRLEATVEALGEGPLARELTAATEVTREMPFAIPLAGVVLVGSIDAIALQPDRVLVIDYKTGDPSAADDESRRLQAACYALPAIRWAGRPACVAFVYADGTEERMDMDEDALQELLSRQVTPLIDGIVGGEFAPLPEYEHLLCTSCPGSAGLCETGTRVR
jgi:ATP-dependent exoDNAse (exonuclease V) beta subunit